MSFYKLTSACWIGSRRSPQLNVFGQQLQLCSINPVTGWFRDGFCRTDRNDFGLHTVCATMTQEVTFSGKP